ncbi:RCC1 domain-containing protein [Nonomuraea sp. NPDC050790]|uniref:RCC1 domain-containing protein n=1 Tax=Nonomuraea sp. NPDC050790 TaxID=3364371 RepID=UPI0037942952
MSRTPRWVACAAALLTVAALGAAPAGAAAAVPADTLTWGATPIALGDGASTSSTTPRQVAGGHDFTDLAHGVSHSAALRTDGTVWTWGADWDGQLGNGAGTVHATVPAQVPGLAQVRQVATKAGHTLALRADGEVYGWGLNTAGQLGDDTRTRRETPVQVKGLTFMSQIATGNAHSLFLGFGNVYATGSNSVGQLGDGTTTTRLRPVSTVTPAGLPLGGFTQIAAGGFGHSMALRSDGTVWTWGNNEKGQLGDGTTVNRLTPVRVNGLNGVVRIAAGLSHSLALRDDGSVWTWGENQMGQLGDGTAVNRSTPVRVSGLSGVTRIDGGGAMSMAARADGTAWTWGYNFSGELGDGTTVNRSTPVQVPGLSGVVEVAAGSGAQNGAVSAPGATPDFTITSPYHPSGRYDAGHRFAVGALVATGALNGSNQVVNLTASVSPPAPGIRITPNPSALVAGTTSTVQIVVEAGVPPGVYTLTFTGTAGAAVHTTAFSFTLVPAPPPDPEPEPEPEPEEPPCHPKLGCP